MDVGAVNNVATPMMTPLLAPDTTMLPIATSGLVPSTMSRMDQLIGMLNGFSSTEMLMALLMTKTPDKHAVHHDDGAMALWGLAQAMQVAALPSAAGFMALPTVGVAAAGTQISVQG
ncbi:MAG: hypothetical protein JWP89_5051 [Schlesneria sp.]|nr:hypothetical protein [Schlesneria sp.]